MIDNGGPAFPRPMGNNGLSNYEEHEHSPEQPGMSLRAWLVGLAMQGLLSNAWFVERYGANAAKMATESLLYADAIIAALKEKP